MSRLLSLSALLLATACGIPSESDLHGVWVNLDMGTLRVFEFADTLDDVSGSPAYHLYLYDSGDDPVLVQSGTYTTERRALNSAAGEELPALVTFVEFSEDSTQVGQEYGNELIDYQKDPASFILASPSGPNGRRTYNWSEIIP